MLANARTARAYAAARIAAGLTLTVAPSVTSPWLADPRSLGAVRLLGARDLALGALALAEPGSAGWRRTMLWCAFADATDVVVAAHRARLGHGRARLAVAAAAIGSTVGFALALARPDDRS